ncbi:MAG: deoxyribonuclease IV [Candidatus Dormibacteria bacterium]
MTERRTGSAEGPAANSSAPPLVEEAGLLVGAHVSTRGGIDRAINAGVAIGAEAIQIHPSPPQTWRPLRLDAETVEAFTTKWRGSGLRAHYLHAVYLVNLAADTPLLVEQSVASLVHHLELAARLGATGVVFHPGSHKGAGFEARRGQMAEAIDAVLARSDAPVRLLIENSAGQGGCVGSSFAEIAAIVGDAAPDERLGVCLDTCHAFASGYDLRDPHAADAVVDLFAAEVGMERLALVHVNDSRTELGGRSDRHANLGEGRIGWAGFRALLSDPRLRGVPWILETPGDGSGPTRAAVDDLRALAAACRPELVQSGLEGADRDRSWLSIIS